MVDGQPIDLAAAVGDRKTIDPGPGTGARFIGLSLLFMAALLVSYLVIAAGLLGMVGAPRGSLAVFSAAMIGFVAAFVYLAAALVRLSGKAASLMPLT